MSKHPPAGQEPHPLPANDLECDPGIGRSKGTTIAGEDPHLADGDNTAEGDIGNDTTPSGGVDSDQRGRDHP